MSEDPRREHLRLAARMAGASIPNPIPPADKFVSIGRLRHHYLDWGGSGRPALVFLHGAGLTAHTWDIACLELRERYRCLALDLRGHGDTSWDPEGDYSFDAIGDDIAGFIDSFELDHPVLIGHSMGGLAALNHAAKSSSELSGLVLVDTVLRPSGQGGGHIRHFMSATTELDSIEEFVELALEFNPRRDRSLLRLSLRQNLRQLPNGRFTWKYDRQAVLGRDPVESERFRMAMAERIGTISCPVLVIRGEDSRMVTAADAAGLAASVRAGDWKEVAGAGHTVQGDNPLGLVAALSAFLAAAAAKG
jgi:pimeloyl-ACP methyl ester carboxylesterase